MKTDRKLLELAALAAGLVYEHPGLAYPAEFKEQVATWHPETSGCDQFEHIPLAEWNPLGDDGDALRLAVALGIQVTVMIPRDHMELGRTNAGGMWNLHGDDPCAATRRAIVRAADEIGKAMLAAKEGTNGKIN